jgi:hypothetical protein
MRLLLLRLLPLLVVLLVVLLAVHIAPGWIISGVTAIRLAAPAAVIVSVAH